MISVKTVKNRERQLKKTPKQKEVELRSSMHRMKSVLVAFSGGVDSAYLALIATQELGEKAVCVTGNSPSVSKAQLDQAIKIAKKYNFNHKIIDTEEIKDNKYVSNPSNRCYYCKSELYEKLSSLKDKIECKYILDGANADDLNDHRPGSKAAAERNIKSPLSEFGFKKDDIRTLSKRLNLETWNKPASPCLASRIQYGIPVTINRLKKVEDGETYLKKLGFSEYRVRYHGELVRLEISKKEMENVLKLDLINKISNKFQQLGFKYVTLDLKGYRTGAMNEILNNQ